MQKSPNNQIDTHYNTIDHMEINLNPLITTTPGGIKLIFIKISMLYSTQNNLQMQRMVDIDEGGDIKRKNRTD